ncbi:hypothetical protein EMIHUDRAFT_245655 [Emiliania huxleyi CCMP1516]|uniref:alpha-1,2-Mannosidase n=2 Tax=Emiliania huxleyi TaxID=2903 RepID=A0A0D3IWG2_EMIH1|nr:hypothetical protein EMIHUDRAFT_245655 [Emiliania huxleyi CCMP1516]EOD15597.1 hypothetical protein EMIHUDRAFT_245655 [Emiliania huxleyi CCMP1516]|eukprot:XP_005768026.1 hypothetical protein EMIHUDRAFT_245655 [Emiliania huxleyi CCMP1516]
MAPAEREQMRQTVEEMFYHAFDGYMERAFPHDELRPISGGYTDALVELGAPAQPTRRGYSGVALTLIDSLDTLAVIGNASEFARGVRWVSENVDFDIDIDVSVFETTIRLLGGLLSAHMLANGTMVDGASHVRVAGYGGELLVLARDLGERLLGARSKFDLLGNTLDPELYAMWNASASAVEQHLRVLAGELRPAAATFEAFHSLWRKFNALPERFDVDRGKLHDTLAYYPLRPELAESCYALYHATRDARYLQIGAEMEVEADEEEEEHGGDNEPQPPRQALL